MILLRIHQALLFAALGCGLAACFYAVRALSGLPHRARRATRFALLTFLLLVADAMGRIPIALRGAEESGESGAFARTALDLLLRNALPVLLFGAALFGRWRGWLADKVVAAAVLIAAALTLLFYSVPL